MTLESVYNEAKGFYEGKYGSLEGNCWWEDEGKPNAILDYLSHFGEFTDADMEFAKKEGISELCLDFKRFQDRREFLEKISA